MKILDEQPGAKLGSNWNWALLQLTSSYSPPAILTSNKACNNRNYPIINNLPAPYPYFHKHQTNSNPLHSWLTATIVQFNLGRLAGGEWGWKQASLRQTQCGWTCLMELNLALNPAHTHHPIPKGFSSLLLKPYIKLLREAFKRKNRKYIGLLPIQGTPPSPL